MLCHIGWPCHCSSAMAGRCRSDDDQLPDSGLLRGTATVRASGALLLRFTKLPEASTAGDSARPALALPPASLDTTKASLISAKGGHRPARRRRRENSATDWAFADCSTTPFPGKPDPGSICVKGGFNSGASVQLQTRPRIRSSSAWVGPDPRSWAFSGMNADARRDANPVAGSITHANLRGSSQSGTFLRLSLLLWLQTSERDALVGRDEPAHRCAVYRSQSAFCVSRWPGFSLRARTRRARVVDEVGRHGAQAPRREPPRPLPRDQHVPENCGDIWIR